MADQSADIHDINVTEDAGAEDAKKTRARDFARMRRIGFLHGGEVLADLTLWGTATAWATTSGLVIAHVVALGNALFAGIIVSAIAHEWGHFAGARLAGAISPVMKKPARLYFMFEFDMQANTTDQFVWLGLGGILTNWLLALLLLVLVPLDTLAGPLLVAVAVAQAVNVSVFEVPVVLRARETGDHQQALDHQLETVGLQRLPGIIAGALAFFALT